jgi:hypothetical protein
VKIVCAEAAFQIELIGAESLSSLHDALRFLLGPFQVAARDLARHGAGKLVIRDDLRAQCSHHLGALLGIAFGHHGHKWISTDSANDREASPGVSTRQLDYGLAPLGGSRRFRILDDLPHNAVFLRVSGVQVFQLGKDLAAQVSSASSQARVLTMMCWRQRIVMDE